VNVVRGFCNMPTSLFLCVTLPRLLKGLRWGVVRSSLSSSLTFWWQVFPYSEDFDG